MSETSLIQFVQTELSRLADPAKAAPMQAYMKTEMSFYGVPKPLRAPIARELKKRFPPSTAIEYRQHVFDLWGLPHREEKYLAIGYAESFRQFINFDQVDLYERLIVEGAWWDFVDEAASHLVGRVVLDDRKRMRPVLEKWIDGSDIWLRRTAIISQLGHKDKTDWAMLSDFSLRRPTRRSSSSAKPSAGPCANTPEWSQISCTTLRTTIGRSFPASPTARRPSIYRSFLSRKRGAKHPVCVARTLGGEGLSSNRA